MYRRHVRARKLPELWWLAAGVVVIAAILAIWIITRPAKTKSPAHTSPVPVSIAHKVSFPIYYPDPGKLPAGYHLDDSSFASPVKNGVNYTVIYDGGKKMVFSVQAKPSDNDLQSFNSSYIPLRIDYQTPVGQAEIGAYHNQTLVSLPIVNGPWVIITAPPDINQDQLKQVLQAMRD